MSVQLRLFVLPKHPEASSFSKAMSSSLLSAEAAQGLSVTTEAEVTVFVSTLWTSQNCFAAPRLRQVFRVHLKVPLCHGMEINHW